MDVAREVFNGLLPELRAKAFVVAGIEAQEVLRDIRQTLADIPASGRSWAEIREEVAAMVSPYLATDAPEGAAEARAQLLMRTHGFQAYAVANERVLQRQKETFPFWQYLSLADGNVRPTHKALHGVVAPADSRFWHDHTPPWDWGCRCRKVALLPEEVEEMRAAEAGKDPEHQLVMEGANLKLLEQGRLNRGPSQQIDVRSPTAKGREAGFSFDPGVLIQPASELRKRYEAAGPEGVAAWREFEAWARGTEVSEGVSVWRWVQGTVVPEGVDSVDAHVPWPKVAVPDHVDKATLSRWDNVLTRKQVIDPVAHEDVAKLPSDVGPFSRIELQRSVQGLLNLLPRELVEAAGPFRVSIHESLAPAVRANWGRGEMRISHLANDKVLRATVWHEMAHWLWDAADKHPKLAKWRADLEEHFAQRTANDELQTHKDGWKFLRDKWISDYAGRADYEGRKPGVEVPSVYLSYLSDGPVGGAMWDHDPHAVETFKLVMSILGPP